MKGRFLHLLSLAAAFLAAGLLYAAFVAVTGLAVPCGFYQLTGLQCPGCGMTRMCLALLRGDLRGAFYYNGGVLLALPVLAGIFAVYAARYVKNGDRRLGPVQRTLLVGVIIWLLAFAVWRNLPA